MNGLQVFYLNVDVGFSKPMTLLDGEEGVGRSTVVGFIQDFGCTAKTEDEAKAIVERLIKDEFKSDPALRIRYDWCGAIADDKLEEEIYSDGDITGSPSFSDPCKEGVWYRSGHGFYYPDTINKARTIAKVSMAVAAFSGVLGAIALFVCVVPWQEEGLACFQIVMLVLFLVSVSLCAVSSGIARSGEAPCKRSRAKALFARGASCLLFLMGIFFLVAGHGYYVRAMERESQQNVLLARDGHYENPYWEKSWLCDFLGIASLGSWCLWHWLSFLSKVAESTARRRSRLK